MELASTKASLVETRDFADSVTATIPRAEFEAALATEEPTELFLEVKQPTTGDTGDVAVAWDRADLEELLAQNTGSTVTLAFDRGELEAILADVEAHGLREKAAILTIATAAFGGAAAPAMAGHDEMGMTERGITPSYVAVHDEATLAERGISATPLATMKDEATLAARGIDAGSLPATHDEAALSARGIETGSLPATHDEAVLSARGIEASPAHDEATLAARGIEATAMHDEATLAARGIDAGSLPSVHDEATLAARGITPVTPAGGTDGGLTIDEPAIDPTTAALVGGAAGLGLLITAAGFAARRRVEGKPA